jgi:hypothetical protein
VACKTLISPLPPVRERAFAAVNLSSAVQTSLERANPASPRNTHVYGIRGSIIYNLTSTWVRWTFSLNWPRYHSNRVRPPGCLQGKEWTITFVGFNHLTHLLMELSSSWEAVNFAATQEPPSILWNPKVHYRVQKSPPLVPILSPIIPIHTIQSISLRSIFNIVHPTTSWSSQWSLSFWHSHQYSTCIPLLPQSCYMPCPSHPPWL